ncbi:MAG: hypothetical protein ACREPC_15855, partial [Stenotrophomonas sp.]
MKVRRFVLHGKRQQLGDIHTLLLPIDCCDWKDLSPSGSIASLIHLKILFQKLPPPVTALPLPT